jgi:hypothetical protein
MLRSQVYYFIGCFLWTGSWSTTTARTCFSEIAIVSVKSHLATYITVRLPIFATLQGCRSASRSPGFRRACFSACCHRPLFAATAHADAGLGAQDESTAQPIVSLRPVSPSGRPVADPNQQAGVCHTRGWFVVAPHDPRDAQRVLQKSSGKAPVMHPGDEPPLHVRITTGRIPDLPPLDRRRSPSTMPPGDASCGGCSIMPPCRLFLVWLCRQSITSQDCSGRLPDGSRCPEWVTKSLSVRTHVCPRCGLVMDRDEHSGRLIKERALHFLAGTRASVPLGRRKQPHPA